MTHVDEGVLLAIRDGEPVSDDDRVHAAECGTCHDTLREATLRSEAIASTLRRDDVEVDVEAAKRAVRARLDTHRARRGVWRRGGQPLRRAAAILLVTAGAAYAIPGSPVRDWLRGGESSIAVDPLTGDPIGEAGAGVSLLVDGAVEVELAGVEEGSEVSVVWSEGSLLRLWAGPGSTYDIAAGRAGARVAAGPVVIEAPRSASRVSITINERMVFLGSPGDPGIIGVVRQTEDSIVFLAPGG